MAVDKTAVVVAAVDTTVVVVVKDKEFAQEMVILWTGALDW